MSQYTPKAKRSISPLTITVTLEASRINESGTLLGFTVKKINKGLKVSAPPQGGGSIYIRLEDGMTLRDAGIELLAEGEAKAVASSRKLF
jgi:hypothetical protein